MREAAGHVLLAIFGGMFRGILAFLVVVSCTAPNQNASVQVFKYNEVGGISSLDPAFARSQSNIWAVNQLFDGLVRLDSLLVPQPALATRWTVDSAGLVYTFYLKQGVEFVPHPAWGNKARVLRAADVVYTLNRLASPALQAPGAWVVRGVQKVEALHDSAVQIALTAPDPAFLGLLAMPYCLVVPEGADSIPDFGRNPVGTGPFYLKLWVDQEKLVMRRNPRYHMAGLPKLEAVNVRFIADKQAAFLEFLSGRLHFISGLDGSYKDEVFTPEGGLKEAYAGKIALQTTMYLNTEYLGFRTDPFAPGLQDVRVRRALSMGFDRGLMLKALRNNLGYPAVYGMIPPALPGAYTAQPMEYNPAKARELLKEANLPPDFQVTLLTNPSYLDLCEFIQASWKQLGVDARVEVVPPATLRQQMATGKAGFFRGSWIADYPEAGNYLGLFAGFNVAPAGPNYTRFNNPTFNDLFARAQAEPQEEKRREIYMKADSLVQAELPVLPLFYDQVVRLVDPRVRGFSPNALNLLDLREVWISETPQ